MEDHTWRTIHGRRKRHSPQKSIEFGSVVRLQQSPNAPTNAVQKDAFDFPVQIVLGVWPKTRAQFNVVVVQQGLQQHQTTGRPARFGCFHGFFAISTNEIKHDSRFDGVFFSDVGHEQFRQGVALFVGASGDPGLQEKTWTRCNVATTLKQH